MSISECDLLLREKWGLPEIRSNEDDFMHSLIFKKEFPTIKTEATASYITGI